MPCYPGGSPGAKVRGGDLPGVIKGDIGRVSGKLQAGGAILPNSSNRQMAAVKMDTFQKCAVFLLVTTPLRALLKRSTFAFEIKLLLSCYY